MGERSKCDSNCDGISKRILISVHLMDTKASSFLYCSCMYLDLKTGKKRQRRDIVADAARTSVRAGYTSGKSWARHHLENPETPSIFTGPRSCFLGECKGLQLPGARREITAGCWTAVAERGTILFLIQVHWLFRIGWSNSSCWFSVSSLLS